MQKNGRVRENIVINLERSHSREKALNSSKENNAQVVKVVDKKNISARTIDTSIQEIPITIDTKNNNND